MLVLFTVGMTLATSAVNVFYRDINPVVQIGLQLWLYLTPVAYPLSAVPERYRCLLHAQSADRHRRRDPVGAGVRPGARLAARRGVGRDDHRGARLVRWSCSSAWTSISPMSSKCRRRNSTRSRHQAVSRRPLAHARRSGRSASIDSRGQDARGPQRDARQDDRTISALRRRVVRSAGGRGPRHHRPQRRRQDDAAEADLARDVADQRQGARRRPRRVAHRARRRLSSRADRPRERLSRRRPVRPDAQGDRSAVRRDRRVCRRRRG